MRERRETPEPWAGALERAEIRSLTQLGEKTGVAVQTLARLVHGEGTASATTITKVASALRPADARQVARWAGQRWNDRTLELPEAARRLTPKQWAAVVAVIKSMADPGEAENPGSSRVRELKPRGRAPHQDVPYAAMEDPRPGDARRTPPGESEEPHTER